MSMNNLFNREEVNNSQSYMTEREQQKLSRQASAFERFAGEFADTHVSYQNINGFILPLQVA